MVVQVSDSSEHDSALLRVCDLTIVDPDHRGTDGVGATQILDSVSIDVGEREAVGLTGQSGSGKSTLLRSILGLVDPAFTASGSILFDGREIMSKGVVTRADSVLGSSLAFVWQNPGEMLHPMHRVSRQITEHLRIHEGLSKSAAIERARESLETAGVRHPGDMLTKYPHELSGGEAQRVCLAQALVTKPKLLVADEILSSLDPETSEAIVETLHGLIINGLSVIFASHDLDTIQRLCRRTVVMYHGKSVEQGPTEQVLSQPSHPHTQALVQANRHLQGPV